MCSNAELINLNKILKKKTVEAESRAGSKKSFGKINRTVRNRIVIKGLINGIYTETQVLQLISRDTA
jgi:hypothetical protein